MALLGLSKLLNIGLMYAFWRSWFHCWGYTFVPRVNLCDFPFILTAKNSGVAFLLLGVFRKNLPFNSSGKNCWFISVEVFPNYQLFIEKWGNNFGEQNRGIHSQRGCILSLFPLKKKTANYLIVNGFMWSMRDSNSPPLDCQSNALARWANAPVLCCKDTHKIEIAK